MAETEQTKVCPLCAETIKAAAKVCPHCRKSQRRWVFMTRYDLIAVVVTLLFLTTSYVFCKIYYQGRDFSLDRGKIRVTDFHFAVDGERYETNVVMSGILTNESEHSWSIDSFEIRYLNSAGKVFDIDDNSYCDGGIFLVMPHSDHSFKLILDERKSIPQFSNCEIRVTSASDPRASLDIFGF